ncbi:hypothetical protein B296_00041430 [Ensete ventricosum]|uniref:Palmitoyl-protein thioesterase 1 n=1 Tax=Ensete ventricosum TaxID=4639 RepID=A0A426ZGR1_ENSVE|nr:hypothetical protein B296_00041430 [Ensete ventricosum]
MASVLLYWGAIAVLLAISAPTSSSIPFVVLHGTGSHILRNFWAIGLAPRDTACTEIGNGVWDSWIMPLQQQADVVCEKVKEMRELRAGYNIVGLSQGNLIGRAVVEFCEGAPPVKNFISLGGPHVPLCGVSALESGILCKFVDNLIKSQIYSDYVQAHLAPSGYLKIPIFEHDTVLVPRETSWFGYYPDDNFNPILPPNQVKILSVSNVFNIT